MSNYFSYDDDEIIELNDSRNEPISCLFVFLFVGVDVFCSHYHIRSVATHENSCSECCNECGGFLDAVAYSYEQSIKFASIKNRISLHSICRLLEHRE